MTENTFNPGDKVQMKTGGPAMTVIEVGTDGLKCMWMQLKGKASYDQKTGIFPAIALIPYKRPAIGAVVGRFTKPY